MSINFHTAKACSRLESLVEMLSMSNFGEHPFVSPIAWLYQLMGTILPDEQQREAISWLSPLKPWDDHDAVLSSRQDGTNDWLFKTSQFENWLKGESKMFWLSGPRA